MIPIVLGLVLIVLYNINVKAEETQVTARRTLFGRDSFIISPEPNPYDGKVQKLIDVIKDSSSHSCGREISEVLLQTHLWEHRTGLIFDPQGFLNSIKHKTLSIFGDSVGLQLFHALDVDLRRYQSYAHNGNGTHTSNLYMCSKRLKKCGYVEPLNNRFHAAIRYYQNFNATIIFCNDPGLSSIESAAGIYYEFCGKRALMGDYLVIANSGHYRPTGVTIEAYFKSLFRKEMQLAEKYYNVRRILASERPSAVVIWRTIPHVGPIDEFTAFGLNNPSICCPSKMLADCCFSHYDGRFWSNVSRSAEWANRYNEIITTLSRYFKDEVIDWNKLSVKYMSYFSNKNVATHADSMHWCDGGLPKGANLLLFSSITRENNRRIRMQVNKDDPSESFSEYQYPISGLDPATFVESVTKALLPSSEAQRSADKYVIKRGLWPVGILESELLRIVYERSAYNCPHETFNFLIRHHLERDVDPNSPERALQPVGFDAHYFLNMLRGKTLAILGDSLGRQLFHSLDHDLIEFETEVINGNGTHSTNTYICKKAIKWCGFVEPLRNRYYAASRVYGKYNVTLKYCNDPFLQALRFQRGGNFEFCGAKAMQADYVLLATGPWFKPRGEELFEYREHMLRREKLLSISVHLARRNLAEKNPTVKVMWMNIAHVGRIDEYNAMGMNDPKKCCPEKTVMNKDCCYQYKSGMLWSNLSMCVEWVHRFNRIIDSVSVAFKDPLIDWFSLSLQYISYFTPRNVPTHQDAMHWCSGGLNRGTNLLIQDAVQSLQIGSDRKNRPNRPFQP